MKWMHKCSLGWMKARQECLTATDVKDLIPLTKTGRKRSVGEEQHFKVLARKVSAVTEEDCISQGWAARGHILEPFAIDRYNEEDFGGNEWLYHWDDIIITKNGGSHREGELAFSPDACDVTYDEYRGGKPITCIGEVKSYAADHHLICGHMDKAKLEERWQIATAMATKPTIQKAYLLFYNPSVEEQLFIIEYSREDLKDEIATVLDVEAEWLHWISTYHIHDENYCVLGNPNEEQAIIKTLEKQQALNPGNQL